MYYFRSKIKSTQQQQQPSRKDSLSTLKLEDLFGTVSFGGGRTTTNVVSPKIYQAYPNTVPQANLSTNRKSNYNNGVTNGIYDDEMKPGYSSASIGTTTSTSRRRPQQFLSNN